MSAHKTRHAFLCAVTLALATACSAVTADELPDIRSAVFVLVDISQTWHNDASGQRNQEVLNGVNQGILALGKRIERASLIAYGAIGDQAVTQRLICKGVYRPTLLTLGRDTAVIKREDDLRMFLQACSTGALRRKSAPWTDISGAADFMSRQIEEKQTTIDRYAIILSDMKEERGNRGPTSLNLRGFKVLLVYRALPEDDRNPKELEGRLQLWRRRFVEAGATVTAVIDTGLVAQAVAQLAGNGN